MNKHIAQASTQINNKQQHLPNTAGARISWIDIARGIGIILVFFGHTYWPYFTSMNPNNKISNFLVASFHMPLFFFLSGLCFSKKELKFKDFLFKKIKTILIPYAFLSSVWICYECVQSIFSHQFSISYVLNEILAYVLQIMLHPIWFLTCLFCIEIIFYFISKLSNQYIILVSVVFLLIGVLYREKVNVNLP